MKWLRAENFTHRHVMVALSVVLFALAALTLVLIGGDSAGGGHRLILAGALLTASLGMVLWALRSDHQR